MESTISVARRGGAGSLRSALFLSALAGLAAACGSGGPSTPAATGAESATPSAPLGPSAVIASPLPPTATTVTASPTGSSTPTWERKTIPTDSGGPLTHVVWTGSRFLALDGVDGLVLDSIDGRTWSRQPRLGEGYVGLVATGPAGAVAVGSPNAEGVLAIWHSPDGLAWAAAPDAASLHGRDGAFITMNAILSVDGGWLAVGGERVNCTSRACSLVRAVAWNSPDGIHWTRAPDSEAMQHAEMTGVIQTGNGYLAVGNVAADSTGTDSGVQPDAWTSPDGRSWTRSEDQLGAGGAANAQDDIVVDSVAKSGSRIVAIGQVDLPSGGAAQALAWRSDGGPWSRVEIGRFLVSQEVRISTVGGGFVAMFGFGASQACASAIWSSADGQIWSCLGNDPAFVAAAVSDAAESKDIEVLVGSAADGASAWTLPRNE